MASGSDKGILSNKQAQRNSGIRDSLANNTVDFTKPRPNLKVILLHVFLTSGASRAWTFASMHMSLRTVCYVPKLGWTANKNSDIKCRLFAKMINDD